MTGVASVDARTGERIALDLTETGTDELDRAVRAAAALGPALVQAGIPGRAALLRAIAGELERGGDAIVSAADRESGLGTARLGGELARTTFQLRLFAEVLEDGAYLDVAIDHADPHAVPAPRPDLRRMLVPVGPVGVYAASNFPLAFSVAGGDTASALAAGCPVVVKAHPGHPHTAQLAGAAVRRAAGLVGLPDDVLSVIYGYQSGIDLVQHPLLRAAGFTGSVRGGRALFDLACARPEPIPFYGELGSLNPLVVTPLAAAQRAESIGAGLAGSFTLGAGQFCTKPGLAFIPAGPDGQRLTAALVRAAAQVPVGAMLTPEIRAGFLAGAAERVRLPGVRTLLAADGQASPHVVSVSASAVPARCYEECFGPLVVLVEYADTAELLAALDLVPGSLTATVHSGDTEDGTGSVAALVAARLAGRAGRVVYNGFPTGVAVTWAMQHGGPYPSTTSSAHTSVGTAAIRRFLRPVAYQDAPAGLLPAELREENPLRLPRRVDGAYLLA